MVRERARVVNSICPAEICHFSAECRRLAPIANPELGRNWLRLARKKCLVLFEANQLRKARLASAESCPRRKKLCEPTIRDSLDLLFICYSFMNYWHHFLNYSFTILLAVPPVSKRFPILPISTPELKWFCLSYSLIISYLRQIQHFLSLRELRMT